MIVDVQRVDDREVEDDHRACTKTAPPKQPTSAPGCARKRASAPVSVVDASPTHSGWKTVSGCSSRPNAAGASTAGAATAAPTKKPAHSQTARSATRRVRAGRPPSWRRRRDEDQPHQPEDAIHQTTVVASVFELRAPRGVADADDVAADVARQEIVEEVRDQERAEQRPARHLRRPAP